MKPRDSRANCIDCWLYPFVLLDHKMAKGKGIIFWVETTAPTAMEWKYTWVILLVNKKPSAAGILFPNLHHYSKELMFFE